MRRQEIDTLLEALDTSANSNSYWISLSINEDKGSLKSDILQHLKMGSFHFELVKEDIYRGFNDYSEMVFPKGFDNPSFIQKPGNVWNGNRELEIDLITKEKMKLMLIDMLTGEQNFFSRSHLGTPFSFEVAKVIVDDFVKTLNKKGAWQAYNISPNFLNQVDDYYNTNFIQLGYFENDNRDLALGIKYIDEIKVLLTNGYS